MSDTATDLAPTAVRRKRARGSGGAKVVLSVPRRTVWGVILSVFCFIGISFGAGYLLGQRGKSATLRLESSHQAPGHSKAPKVSKKGTLPKAPVEAVVETTEIAPSIHFHDQSPKGRFSIQVGAFSARADAQSFVREHLEAVGSLDVYLLATRLKKRGVWYRVRLGAFASEVEARVARAGLSPALSDGAIVVLNR